MKKIIVVCLLMVGFSFGATGIPALFDAPEVLRPMAEVPPYKSPPVPHYAGMDK